MGVDGYSQIGGAADVALHCAQVYSVRLQHHGFAYRGTCALRTAVWAMLRDGGARSSKVVSRIGVATLRSSVQRVPYTARHASRPAFWQIRYQISMLASCSVRGKAPLSPGRARAQDLAGLVATRVGALSLTRSDRCTAACRS